MAEVREPCLRWLRTHWRRQDAVFVTKILSTLDDLPESAVIDIANWAWRYSDDKDALYRVSRLSPRLLSDEIAVDARRAILRSGFAVIFARRRGLRWPEELDVLSLVILLGNIVATTQNDVNWGPLADHFTASLIQDGDVFFPGNDCFVSQWFLATLERCLRVELLDLNRDQHGLRLFVEWLAADRDRDGFIERFVNRMKEEHSSPVWGL